MSCCRSDSSSSVDALSAWSWVGQLGWTLSVPRITRKTETIGGVTTVYEGHAMDFALIEAYRALLRIEPRPHDALAAQFKARTVEKEYLAILAGTPNLDRDMIDERIRSVLGYAREGDIVIPRAEVERLLAAGAAARG